MSAELILGAELHVYVVEFIGHGVKVGVSERPDKRIAQHRRDAAAYGRQVGRVWLSEPHVNSQARANERSLKKLAGANQRREYLPLSFDEVVAVAVDLQITRADLADVERRREATTEFFKSLLTGGLR
jgi:predicted GIY-YIG superfamily endonuclease